MKKWEKQLVNDFKAGKEISQLYYDYREHLKGAFISDMKIEVEAIIRRWMNR